MIEVAVLQGIKRSFFGRNEDVDDLVKEILRDRQLWLSGESGVGKSVLLQKGVLPKLREQKINVVYLNFWQGDWAEDPAKSLLRELVGPINADIPASLRLTLSEVRDLVIILDQFDEYQIAHRDRFMAKKGH